MSRGFEWFVPTFGSARFRAAVGLLFLPYTGMVLSYVVIGSMLADTVHWDRVVALLVVYFLALGVGAHALDALGSGGTRPWGEAFARRELKLLAGASLLLAYAIGAWYMLRYVPWLWVIAIAEGFFVFAYNLEWFKGRFHNDFWFALSWGALPVLAGYVMQTNSLSVAAVVVAIATGLLSLVEITASRPYKELKREPVHAMALTWEQMTVRLERMLRALSYGVILLGAGLVLWRMLA